MSVLRQGHSPRRGATRNNLLRVRERTRDSSVSGADGLEEIIEAVQAWDTEALASSRVGNSGLHMGAVDACVFRGGWPAAVAFGW